MESNELATVNQGIFISPVVELTDAKKKFEQVREYTASCLKKDIDYGTIEGISKPTLLKPGAEKIGSLFGLSPRFECVDRVLNWTGEGNPDNEPFFYFEYRCNLYRGDQFVGSCDGSCNSWERKYRYRRGSLVCPECGKPTLMKSKYSEGYYCNAKKGGCGKNFKANDTRITEQKIGDVKNFDTAEQVNTFMKMAQKRAYVGAILIACNLSEYYTQDIEDMDQFTANVQEDDLIQGEFTPVQDAPAKQEPEFDENAFLRKWQKPDFVLGMNRESAENTLDSKGQKYGDKPTKDLFFMLRTITKKIDSGMSDEQKEAYGLKVSAICEILQNRKLALILPEERPDPFVNQGK